MAKESISQRVNNIDYLVLSNDKHCKRRCIGSFVKSIN
jgi:rRNA-processing protein FCF1